MRQIFDEFHRYQQPFDWGEQGLGLGLSICQRISRLLDHRLNARSRVGKGSMFSIILPRVAPLPGYTELAAPVQAVAAPVRSDSLAACACCAWTTTRRSSTACAHCSAAGRCR
jgi:hypothetical protein